ncbi:hypothetical protein T492DRAFT_919100 [Pavlovales sp. CCMP2436]|nr:hypothetical protein T492DRAFT_919100 [Pavlovales sp. CCMP2436]
MASSTLPTMFSAAFTTAGLTADRRRTVAARPSPPSQSVTPSEDVGTRTAHVLASLQLPDRPLLPIDESDPHVPTGGAGLGGGLGGGDGGLGGRGGGRQTTAIAEPVPRMASSTLPTMFSAAFRSMADRRRTVAASPSRPSQSVTPSEDVGTRTAHVLASLQLPERPSLASDESDPHVPSGGAGLGGGLGGGGGGLDGRTANSSVMRSSTPVPKTARVALAAPAWTVSDRIVYEPPRTLPAPEQSATPAEGAGAPPTHAEGLLHSGPMKRARPAVSQAGGSTAALVNARSARS